MAAISEELAPDAEAWPADGVISAEGFQRAVLLCAGMVAVGGIAGGARLRDDQAGGVTSEP